MRGVVILLALLTGTASASPYGEVGLGVIYGWYRVDTTTIIPGDPTDHGTQANRGRGLALHATAGATVDRWRFGLFVRVEAFSYDNVPNSEPDSQPTELIPSLTFGPTVGYRYRRGSARAGIGTGKLDLPAAFSQGPFHVLAVNLDLGFETALSSSWRFRLSVMASEAWTREHEDRSFRTSDFHGHVGSIGLLGSFVLR